MASTDVPTARQAGALQALLHGPLPVGRWNETVPDQAGGPCIRKGWVAIRRHGGGYRAVLTPVGRAAWRKWRQALARRQTCGHHMQHSPNPLRSPMNRIPILLCAGANGRALVYGYTATEPNLGQPVRLARARMILYYPSGGTFGLCAVGPPEGSRVTHAVETVVETVWQEWLTVTPAAAEVFDGWAS